MRLLIQVLDIGISPDSERLLWLAGSIVLYVGIRNGLWVLQNFLSRVSWAPAASLLTGGFRFVFYIGIPYLALLTGTVTLKSLGVVPASSQDQLNQGILVAVGSGMLIALIGWHCGREITALGEDAPALLADRREVIDRSWGWVLVLLTAIYQQIHWAFYRALPVLMLDDVYFGGFIGLALVLLERYADPRTRSALSDPSQADFLLLSAGLAVVSTMLFVLTGTSWLGAGVHVAVISGWVVLVQIRKWTAGRRVAGRAVSDDVRSDDEGERDQDAE